MNAFENMFLLVLSIVCIMSRVTVAEVDVDNFNLEDLLEDVASNFDPNELAALLPRGLDMVNQLAEAVEDISKREDVFPAIMHTLTDRSETGGVGILTPEVVNAMLNSILERVFGEKYKNYESHFNKFIEFCFTLLKMVTAMNGSGATQAPATAVATRDVVQEIQGFLRDNFAH